jgi:hypothetical protein
MINDFLVKAFPEKNQLKIILDGYFMQWELELALYLAKKESKKLQRGFNVVIDIREMETPLKNMEIHFGKIKRILKMLGSASLEFVGVDYTFKRSLFENVGFYAYENE